MGNTVNRLKELVVSVTFTFTSCPLVGKVCLIMLRTIENDALDRLTLTNRLVSSDSDSGELVKFTNIRFIVHRILFISIIPVVLK